MSFDREIFWRVLRILFHWRTFSFRRLLGGGGFLVVLFIVGGIRDFFQLLDRIFIPGLRRAQVEAPVFVIANPRSGSTFLHRLLSLDEERFTCMQTWQTLLPSVTLYRLIWGIARVDGWVGRPLGRLLHAFERRVFKGWDGVHHVGFTAPEEEQFIFITTLLDPTAWIMLPFPQQFRDIDCLDDLSEKRQEKVMRLYERSLRAHVYATGGGRVLLSKNVFHGGRLQALVKTFPDARFAYLVRNPLESLGSSMSMFTAPWSFHSPDVPLDGGEARYFADVGMEYYARIHRAEPELKAQGVPFETWRYADLIENPKATVEELYQKFGLEMSEAYQERLTAETSKARRYRSTHKYNLAQFGVTPEEIVETIPEVFEAYGFEVAPVADD